VTHRLFPGRAVRGAIALAAATLLLSCSGGEPSGPQQIQLGSVTLTITGVPGGGQAAVTITGPGGPQSITASGTITGLAAGTWTISAADIVQGGFTWTPAPRTQTISVAPGSSVPTGITYSIATGSLSLAVTGLPSGVQGAVNVSGPAGFSTVVSSTTVLGNLAPGTYDVTAADVSSGIHRYAASPAAQAITVVASTTPQAATVAYDVASGLLDVTITGEPAAGSASVMVTGPNGYSQPLFTSRLLSGLAPGSYTITATTVSIGPVEWIPAPATQEVVVTASTTATPATVDYNPSVGTLDVIVSGLPAGADAALTVTGPAGFVEHLTGSQSLTAPIGSYTVAAASVSHEGTNYTPPPTQAVSVALNATTTVNVQYNAVVSGLNLKVDGAYITQSVQTYANSLPLIAGRGALLRVFVTASEANAAQPAVRVRLYSGGVLAGTYIINAPSASVPLAPTEGQLNTSWNLALDASVLQPGLSILVDVDPANAVPEANEADNAWPATGQDMALDVRTVPTLGITLVPVHQGVNGRTGDVSAANLATFMAPLERMFPVASVDADVHPVFTTAASELGSAGANWQTVLSELYALRIAEGTGRYYYGVVDVSYTSGVAGMGYIGAGAAMGWDYLPGAAEVLAHEVGHNFGRFHAPCGGPSLLDPAWPNSTHAGARIGSYGYDIVSGTLKPPTQFDLMSYCDPSWISDYTYSALLAWHEAHPAVASAPAVTAKSSSSANLLVWGRIESGRLVLEPAFEVDAPASLPGRPGPHRIEGLGPSGESLFSLSFEGERVADTGDPSDRVFAFVVPASMLRGNLAQLRLDSRGQRAERRASGAAPAAATATRIAAGRSRLGWSQSAAGALVRNARTGRILAITRGASVDVPAGSDELEVVVSDGVRSSRTRVRPQ
jgi:hypothetical protein